MNKRKKVWKKDIWNDIGEKLKELGFSSEEIADIYKECKKEFKGDLKS